MECEAIGCYSKATSKAVCKLPLDDQGKERVYTYQMCSACALSMKAGSLNNPEAVTITPMSKEKS